LVYRELRNPAAVSIRRERQDYALQATAVVHETWLQMVDRTQVQSAGRAQFFAIAPPVPQASRGQTRRRQQNRMGQWHYVDEKAVRKIR